MRRSCFVLAPLVVIAAACGGSDSTSAPDTTGVDSGAATSVAITEPTDTQPVETDPPATDPPETDAPETTAAAELAEVPSLGLGEYAVGVQTITITDETRDRPLTVDVWFPLAPGATGEPHRYTFVTGDYYESPVAIDADAASVATDGPFPLVVYSHGSGGLRYIHSNYTEFLASHGYLVVAPDHTGNTAVERISDSSDPGPVIAYNRVEDVGVVIDQMLNPENVDTAPFVAVTDPEQIAVTGHSFGGFTTYAVASGYDNEIGSVEADTRVDAIIPLAPAVGSEDPTNQLLSDEQLAAISVPALVMVGTNDQTTPIDPNVTRAWEFTNSEPSYRVELVDAQHNTFTDICAYQDFFPQLPEVNPLVIEAIEAQAGEGCSVGDMAIPRAQDITNTFAVTFLDSVFDGTAMFDPETYAVPDDVIFMVK